MSNNPKAGAIDAALLKASSERFDVSPVRILGDSIARNGVDNTSIRQQELARMSHIFSTELEPMHITNQKKSGRCWIFAGMNVMRYALAKKCHLKEPDFELSQSFMMFYDKLEKANFFLTSVLETAAEKKDSRVVMWLFANPLNDGGQWDMLVSVIEKYGLLPKYAMPESYHSSNSGRMNSLLSRKLRRDGVELRRMVEKSRPQTEIAARKDEMVSEFYGLLCSFLGEPPRTFDFAYRDKDNNYFRDSGLTPVGFYQKYWGADFLDRFVSVINAPTDDKRFGRTYTVKFLGNVVGGRRVTYLNLPVAELKRAASAQLHDGVPVWFGSDVGKWSERENGILDTKLFNYEGVLGTKLNMSKADMLDYGESCLTHAMMLLGVDEGPDGVHKWKVENSWGEDVGKKGFFVMSDDWFGDYVCQVVVDKKYLTPEQLKALDGQPAELEPWDPIGSLAD